MDFKPPPPPVFERTINIQRTKNILPKKLSNQGNQVFLGNTVPDHPNRTKVVLLRLFSVDHHCTPIDQCLDRPVKHQGPVLQNHDLIGFRLDNPLVVLRVHDRNTCRKLRTCKTQNHLCHTYSSLC